jgi:DNA primase
VEYSKFSRDNVLSALRFLGISVETERRGWFKVRCINPAHEDQDASAGFNIYSGAYSCFGCSYTTGVAKLIQERLNCTFKEAENLDMNLLIHQIHILY